MSEVRTARPPADPRERLARQFFHMVNPLARWMMSVGIPTGSRNVLLTVRGRRSGMPRTTPVSMLELEGRRFVQASYSEDGWVRNLRAAGQATVTDHGRRIAVQTLELPPDAAAAIIRRALAPYHRSRLLRALLGPRVRPPVAVLRWIRLRVDDTPEEYVAEAQRHPLFELQPIREAAT
ncbi:MAG: nitroreductase family deazaflavin-dependent oxidoreductase [Chloroflexi bacterium]|nr:nitroreductase family deazaflavin-dependent oxidoreductase [Chloroflexota bacterium]